MRRVRVEFLSRLYVAQLLDLPTENLLAHQKTACVKRRDFLLVQRHANDRSIGALALELEIAQTEAILGWIAQLEIIPASF